MQKYTWHGRKKRGRGERQEEQARSSEKDGTETVTYSCSRGETCPGGSSKVLSNKATRQLSLRIWLLSFPPAASAGGRSIAGCDVG